jgi:hypothetical protein
MQTKRRTPPKYEPLTHMYARWLFELIDRRDWGYFHRYEGHPVYAATNGMLDDYQTGVRKFPPDQLPRTQLQSHLHGTDKLYCTSLRKSGFAFS